MSRLKQVTAILDQQLDRKNIDVVLRELRSMFPERPYGPDKIFFDKDGCLLDEEPGKTVSKWVGYNTPGSKNGWEIRPNPDWSLGEPNVEFVDAIKLDDIPSGKPRHGYATFTRFDGRGTHMSFKQYKDVAPHLIRGWLIGRFAHRKYYGSMEILLLERFL